MAEPLKHVTSRSTVTDNKSMWGNMYTNPTTGDIDGWVVNTWTERGIYPPWMPKMHWVSKPSGKFFHMVLSGRALHILDEDTTIDANRAAFITKTISHWEKEWAANL